MKEKQKVVYRERCLKEPLEIIHDAESSKDKLRTVIIGQSIEKVLDTL